jgi:hypothetical protein
VPSAPAVQVCARRATGARPTIGSCSCRRRNSASSM